ncbi:MAG: response regulator transcription factor [Chloroflexota bacterium]|nr:response regulator transcription factor [Chloroflexota bacterium]
MNKIRVLIVDDHAILREGVRSLLALQKDIEVVGEAVDGAAALRLVPELNPDVVLMDIAMPGMDGIEATRRIKQTSPQTKVLVLTQHDNKEYMFSVLQAGASGYVLKRAGGAEVVTAIRGVYEEGAFLPPRVAKEVMSHYVRPPAVEQRGPHLTEREKQVLILVAEDKSNREIAEHLSLSVKTVMVHRANIMEKLGVHSRTELVKYALRQGLVSL